MVVFSLCRLILDEIGGILPSFRVCRLAEKRGVQYVNHTFKSHLSLAAALHVFATNPDFNLLEYPAAGSELSQRIVENRLRLILMGWFA